MSRARALARGEGCDALWVNDPANVRYLSGFTGSAGYILLVPRKGFFITDSRYELQAASQVHGLEVVVARGRLAPLLRELASGSRVERMGFSGLHLSFDEVQAFRRALRGVCAFAPLKGSLASLRAAKDESEVRSITRAVRVSERAWKAVAAAVRPGMSEKQISDMLACELIAGGCEGSAFDIIVACGPRSALPHAFPSGRRVGARDLLLVDWGARCGGYHSDTTRVFFTGEPRAELRAIHRVVLEAQAAALEAVHAGARAAAVDAAARSVIEAAGYGRYFGHALGHGVGLEVHESPALSSLSKDVLEPGMVFTLEPGIYLPGKGGVRIEDVVHLDSDGPRVLSRLPRTGEWPAPVPR